MCLRLTDSFSLIVSISVETAFPALILRFAESDMGALGERGHKLIRVTLVAVSWPFAPFEEHTTNEGPSNF